MALLVPPAVAVSIASWMAAVSSVVPSPVAPKSVTLTEAVGTASAVTDPVEVNFRNLPALEDDTGKVAEMDVESVSGNLIDRSSASSSCWASMVALSSAVSIDSAGSLSFGRRSVVWV